MNHLYYIYDPMCSWCYAFSDTFEKLKEKLDSNIKIEYIPGGLAVITSYSIHYTKLYETFAGSITFSRAFRYETK